MTAVLTAAKESAHVFPLAALRLFAEKPHQGHRTATTTFRLGATIAISNTATAFPVCLYDSGIRSCCSGKERDAETGLDYFGARYMSSTQGRWTSPDKPFADQHREDPQSWNLYGYVRNNPLNKVDLTGTDALWIRDKDTKRTTLMIPVHFTGSGATTENIIKILDREMTLDTGGRDVHVISTDKPVNGVLNEMDLSPGYDFTNYPDAGEGTDALGGNKAHIKSDSSTSNDAAAHDILHFAGIKDQYVEGPRDASGNRTSEPTPGYDKTNIMTDRSGTKLKPKQVDEAKTNKTTKQCTSTLDGKIVCSK
jgi:RHS repeat-associated protein